MSHSNVKDCIRAATLFNSLPVDKQEEENRNLNILLGGVLVEKFGLESDEDYRSRLFSELLGQLPPDSEYPSAFIRTYPPPNTFQPRIFKKRTFDLVREFVEGRAHISTSSKVEAFDFPSCEVMPSQNGGISAFQHKISIPDEELKNFSDSVEIFPILSKVEAFDLPSTEAMSSQNRGIETFQHKISTPDDESENSLDSVENIPYSSKVETFVPSPPSFEILTPPLLDRTKNQGNGDSQHMIIISKDGDKKWPNSAGKITREMPKLLNRTAGRSSCSIFRVPQSLMEIHPKAFQPQIVSIGPYHHGKEHLHMIQEHKQRFLDAVLARTHDYGVSLNDFYRAIAKKKKPIRECYSENTDKYSDHEFIEMMVLDGCFIIELFCIVGRLVQTDPNDPIFALPWILYTIMRDLLRLENQIPFFVLQTLFELSMSASRKVPSLAELTLGFFNYSIQRSDEIRAKNAILDGEHLLDFFRLSFIPSTKQDATGHKDHLQLIQPVEKLRAAGIEFMQPVETAESFLDIKFWPNGVLEIPPLAIDDFTSSFLLNGVAFEQCYKHCSSHFTSYVIFIGCLINTPTDAGYLRDHRVIENYFGTDKEVVKFFNEVGKETYFDIERSYLAKVFEDVNDYYRNDWHVTWAGFKYTYLESTWAFISALAALVLLILTIIQSFFAVYGYVNPPQ